MPIRAYYSATISEFLTDDVERILGILAAQHHHALEQQQTHAWRQQISILKISLSNKTDGKLFLEFYIPRMGKRVDAVLIAASIVFVIEFKAGATRHESVAFDQVEDYALDLKNFHEGSHSVSIVPVLVSTKAESQSIPELIFADDLVASPVGTNDADLGKLIDAFCASSTFPSLNIDEWIAQGYKPTPTIVEAAEVLYRTHSVVDISRSDADSKNLQETSASVGSVIDHARQKDADREVRSFIQNIRHFRDEYVGNDAVPTEKVVVFDEAQRAWTRKQAAAFMQRKRGQSDFDMSEPEFLIRVMDRHTTWCAIVCLVGEGQEINTGEAGISEWISAVEAHFPEWAVHISPRLVHPENDTKSQTERFLESTRVHADRNLHLAVSMRSFRAEAVSELIGHIIDNEPESAREICGKVEATYPICLTRDLSKAKAWLRGKGRGTQRFGLVASSGAQRLRPEGIHIKARINPVNWFLNDASDVRSSFYLEDVASEFAVQGLELDWVGVCWDGDFHYSRGEWISQDFVGTEWRCVNDEARLYLKNAYRVLLTRARQGMVLFVPKGDRSDRTRPSSFYDGTFEFLQACGIESLD